MITYLVSGGVIIWITCGIFCGVLAKAKGYETGQWALLGLIFGPLALLAMVGMPVKTIEKMVQPPVEIKTSKVEAYKSRRLNRSERFFLIVLFIVAGILAMAAHIIISNLKH